MNRETEDSRGADAPRTPHSPARRRLLLLLPAAVFGSIAATLAAAAFKFLRPRVGLVSAGDEGGWQPVAPVAELAGAAQPLRRELSVEAREGWTAGAREYAVFVLPGRTHRVVSAVCPHEGCEVEWRAEAGEFLCPCHDSRFGAGGERLSGPAGRDLVALPTRVSGDLLEAQYRPVAACRASAAPRADA